MADTRGSGRVEALRERPDPRGRQTAEKRVIWLWAVPRSMSTVIVKAFTRLPGISVVHEPFTDAYYFGAGRRSARYGSAQVTGDLIDPSGYESPGRFAQGTTFIKELAFQGVPFVTDAVLKGCTHTFLMRHPERVVASLLPLKPDFTEDELGFTALEYLLLLVDRTSRQDIAILDGDRLRADPALVMQRYCDWIEVPFDPAMLFWTPGPVRPWKDHEEQSQRKWHARLEASRGFLPPPEQARFTELRRQLSRPQCAYVDRALDVYQRIHNSFSVL
jgi:hypothetical protein